MRGCILIEWVGESGTSGHAGGCGFELVCAHAKEKMARFFQPQPAQNDIVSGWGDGTAGCHAASLDPPTFCAFKSSILQHAIRQDNRKIEGKFGEEGTYNSWKKGRKSKEELKKNLCNRSLKQPGKWEKCTKNSIRFEFNLECDLLIFW